MPDIRLILTTDAEAGKVPPSQLVYRQVGILRAEGIAWGDMPAWLRGPAWLDRYAGEVANGGHSQFISNAGEDALAGLQWAADGAELLGVADLASLVVRARDWMISNPGEALDQTGFTGGRAPALDVLDKEFGSLDHAGPDVWHNIFAVLDTQVAENLAGAHGVGTSVLQFTPVHHAMLDVALLTRVQHDSVAAEDFEAQVRRAIPDDDIKPWRKRKPVFDEIKRHLPGHWFCGVLLAVDGALPDGTMIEVWGFDTLSRARPRAGAIETLPLAGQTNWTVTVEKDVITVTDHPQSRREMLTAVPAQQAKGFFARRRQRKQNAAFESMLAAEDQRAREAPSLVGSVAAGKALCTIYQDMHLAEALLLLREELDLGVPFALRLLRAEFGAKPRVDWEIQFGFDKAKPKVRVMQMPDAVLIRIEDTDQLRRYDSATLLRIKDA